MTDRTQTVLFYEGHVLQVAGSYGRERAEVHAHAAIDGAMNALIRLQGAEAAAHFAFALGDRVAAGMRAPTEFKVAAPVVEAVPAVVAAAEPAPASKPEQPPPKPVRFWSIFLIGWLCGFVVGRGTAQP